MSSCSRQHSADQLSTLASFRLPIASSPAAHRHFQAENTALFRKCYQPSSKKRSCFEDFISVVLTSVLAYLKNGAILKKVPKVKKIVYSGSRRRTEYVRFSLSRSSSVPTPVHSTGFQSTANEFESIPSSSASSLQASHDDAGRGPLTRYQCRRQKLAEAWSALRANLLDARVEEMSPATHRCSKCCREEQ